ncbi:hypothetical protein K440DRAFT_641688 [Wilcoxina mikolae CBS 423.85]|nr:hypothetical protein K440DRAFT_641688 [Wilcoxina mikolae CBS 423.85]
MADPKDKEDTSVADVDPTVDPTPSDNGPIPAPAQADDEDLDPIIRQKPSTRTNKDTIPGGRGPTPAAAPADETTALLNIVTALFISTKTACRFFVNCFERKTKIEHTSQKNEFHDSEPSLRVNEEDEIDRDNREEEEMERDEQEEEEIEGR